MTVRHVGEQPQHAERFSVIGIRAFHSERAVSHVGLLPEAGAVQQGEPVELYEMGPPMRVGAPIHGAARGQCVPDAFGHLDVSPEERREVEAGIEKWLQWIAPQSLGIFDYVALPAYVEESDAGVLEREEDGGDAPLGRVYLRKCSCSGFVERAYARGAGIRLVVDEERLPLVSLAVLREIWGHVFSGERRGLLRRAGLDGPGPFRVLMPGYLLYAIDQPSAALPFQPGYEHAWF